MFTSIAVVSSTPEGFGATDSPCRNGPANSNALPLMFESAPSRRAFCHQWVALTLLAGGQFSCLAADGAAGGLPSLPRSQGPTATRQAPGISVPASATTLAAVESSPPLNPGTRDDAAVAKSDATGQPVVEALMTTESTRLIDVERSYRVPLGSHKTHQKSLATRYANLQPAACRAELRHRKIAAVRAVGMAVGIASPMRLVGPLRGVRFVTPGPKSVHGKLDCRLVLLLDELASLLDQSGVSVVYVDGFYRPRAHLPGKKAPSQHSYGLAMDIHAFGTKDGSTLLVERDFSGKIGEPVCGEAAWLQPESRGAIELRNIVCALARGNFFHYLLTPNYDEAHGNHLHGDIKRGGHEHVLR